MIRSVEYILGISVVGGGQHQTSQLDCSRSLENVFEKVEPQSQGEMESLQFEPTHQNIF